MAIYPNGTAASGVYDIFQGTNFTPNDVVRGIRDNYSPVNRTTMLNSLGYQVGLIQNFVNASYLGRQDVPVQNGYLVSGWATGAFTTYSGALTGTDYTYAALFPCYLEVKNYDTTDISYFKVTPDAISFLKQSAYVGLQQGALSYSGLYVENISTQASMYLMNASGSAGSLQAVWKVDNTDTLYIGNDSDSSYSGILSVNARGLQLKSDTGIYLQGINTSATVTLYFCGAGINISGGTSSSNFRTYNNFFPLVDNERELGDENYRWKDAYISKTFSKYIGQILYNDGGSSTLFDGTVNTTVGHLYGAVPSITTPSVSTAMHNAGDVLIAQAGIYPNALLVGRSNASGYLRINSGGQLEFYKIGESGWVLTGF